MKKWLCTTAIVGAIAVFTAPAYAITAPAGCDTGFDNVDTDGNGVVSTQEANSASEKDFQRLDADGSGVVSKAEWQNCGLSAQLEAKTPFGGEVHTESLSEMNPPGARRPIAVQPLTETGDFEIADADRSGDVTVDEAAKAAEQAYEAADSDASAEEFARVYGERFAMLDANSDGTLSQEEWNDRDNAKVDAAFTHIDANDDGELSKSEYQEARNISNDAEAPITIWYYYIY